VVPEVRQSSTNRMELFRMAASMDILESEGTPIGRKIEYKDDVDPPSLRFLDDKGVI
jgi:hypothetical protein